MDKMLTVVVTGATGLVGSYLCRTLVAAGTLAVVGVKRDTSSLDLLGDVADSMSWLMGDLHDPYFIDEIAGVADILVHTAALISFDPRDRQQMIAANVSITRDIVNAALRHDVQQMVFISSVAAIGRLSSGAIISETTDWVDSRHNTSYATSKYLSELEVWRGYAEGLPVSVLNPSIILGGGYWHQGSTALIGKVAGGLPFYGAGATAVVDVRDLVQAIVTVIDQQLTGQRYIIAGHNVSYQSLFGQIAEHLGVPAPSRVLSPLMGRIAWRLEALRSRLTGKRPLITKETIRNSHFVSIYDVSKSIDELGIDYRPLHDTLRDISAVYDTDATHGLLEID